MRTFSAKTLAALQSGSVALVQLLKMDFSGTPIYLNSSTWDLVWQRLYNLLRYSEQFENAAWLKSNLVVTSNATVAPDGSNTADLLTQTGPGYINQGAFAADLNTFSFYAKPSTSDWVIASLKTYAGGTETAWFNVATGYLGSKGANLITTIQPAEYGFFRCSLTKIAATTSEYTLIAATSGNGVSTNASGNAVYVWGAQLEPGELATTYTPTTATALTDPGLTYKGAFGLGQISAITDKPGEVQGISLELHGADAARISLALDDSDIVQGTPVEIRTALIDTTTYQILDAPVEWVGTMDTMSIAEDGTSATIAVTCESKAVDLLRGNVAMYSDADQRAINPTDASFSYVVDQIDKPIVWPSREFFYK